MLSIIIPTYNEAGQIAETITATRKAAGDCKVEIIVADGGSTDETRCKVIEQGAVFLPSSKGRAVQMNAGAGRASYENLYFLHADSRPPIQFARQILGALASGISSGCFRLAFDHPHWFLRFHAWFTRFDVNAVRFGDQSLFVKKRIFFDAGGFREDLIMMEDQEIIHRLKEQGKFRVLPGYVTTSARKYLDNGVFRMQWIFYRLWAMYYLGYSQQSMLQLHRRLIRKHKL